MELKNWQFNQGGWGQRVLQWVNLRPEEGERTLLMFAFYTATSIGLLWLEAVTYGLFLDKYGAESLTIIYIASSAIGSGLGFFYSWLQEVLPMRRAIVAIALLMALPLVLFRVGLELPLLFGITVFSMRLWIDGAYILNDLNTSITANQLFNIREIKRTYPIISSGILLADVISGFSLPALISRVGLRNVTLMACFMLVLGAFLLFYLSENYRQAFPDASRRTEEEDPSDYATRRFQGPLRTYVWLLVTFFVLVEILYVLIEFQFYSELELQFQGGVDLANGIASFVGIFNGILGIFELVTQWFASSRVVERMGVFRAGSILPMLVVLIGVISISSSFGGWFDLFLGVIAIKFVDELFHYTLIEGTGPVLFQPLPESQRNNMQALVNGVAEPVATGVAGLAMWTFIWGGRRFLGKDQWQALQSPVFVFLVVLVALAWIAIILLMRSRYVGLLVSSAERGRLGVSDVDLRVLKRSVVETLEKPKSDPDKRSCVELLAQIDPKNVGEVLAPLLATLSPALQRQSLEVMLEHPKAEYLPQVRALIDRPQPPEVLALALRYVWLTERTPDMRQLRPYLRPEVDPVVRATAASLILRKGNREQKAEATNALRRMLTHKQERERVMGTRALGEADFLQGLRLYVPNLLQDESLRVRCALLEVIASTHLEEYYPSLLRGLSYKSTRDAAMQALVRLDNEVLDRLVTLAEDVHKPDLVRMYAWSTIGEIGTVEALDVLVAHLMTAWGTNRRNILRILLKMPEERGIEGVLDRLGRRGVEILIDQELMFVGQLYAALVDLPEVSVPPGEPEAVASRPRTNGHVSLTADYAIELLRRALQDLQADSIERLFLLMKFLYPLSSIQAAAFNLKSGSRSYMARGLEILDNTIDIPSKRSLLSVLDRQGDAEKLQNLSELVDYQPMSPSDRLRFLLELRLFLSDWPLACCFHVARVARWSIGADQTLAGLRHPTGFVREAVLAYLEVASPRALLELLPKLQNDPDPLVAAQVRELMVQFGLSSSKA
ncbi:MFS transporter [Baaleninema simplex]|uniref:MFS transporter n=1 Tax=Baaleninema simplex TaxID=2862350 RepID=UPI00034B16AA|nr:MFS transporter [Baaleninema simplex]